LPVFKGEIIVAREFAKEFYNSKAWHKTKNAFIKSRIATDGGMCQECHDRPGVIVHHRHWLTPSNINDPDITLSWSNLEYVCHNCHDIIHERVSAKISGMVVYEFTADGDVVERQTEATRGKDIPPS
jgi:uncharacterized protein YlaI